MQSDSGEFINVIHWASNRIRGSSWSSTRPTTLIGAANLSPYDAAALEGRDNTGVTSLLAGYSFATHDRRRRHVLDPDELAPSLTNISTR